MQILKACGGTLPSNEKRIKITDTCYNMNEPQRHLCGTKEDVQKKKSTYYLVLLIGRARRVKLTKCWDFPGSPVVKNLPFNVGDKGSIPGQGTKIPCTQGN